MANKNPDTSGLRPAWKPGTSGNPKGRPKSRVDGFKTKIMGKANAKKFYGITPMELQEWYETLITLNLAELKALLQDETTPALICTYTRAIITNMNAGKTATVDKIVERLYGKAIQRVEHTGADGSDLMPARTLTKDEAKELFNDLEREY